jgi:imidazoleglycerol-phosphate dehydratase
VDAKISRKTKETQIELSLNLKGGATRVSISHPFLSHMLESFAKHSGAAVQLSAKSLDQDEHHLVEDVAITIGRALKQAVGEAPIKRFGDVTIPMDDALVAAVLDFGGRSYYEGPLPDPMFDHFFRSLCHEAGITCHLGVIRGRDPHHITEAAFKAFARALHQAWQPAGKIQSTKGEVELSGG